MFAVSSGSPMQVVHCAAYGGPYAGSFIPMLEAAANEANSRGYPTTLIFSEAARGRAWLADLDQRLPVRVVDLGSSRRQGLWPAMHELMPILDRSDRRVVLHTHFSGFDIPAALLGARSRKASVVWHAHTRLSDDRRIRIRNTARYRVLGPVISRILCVSPELREALRRRGAPAKKLVDFPNAIDTRRFAPVTREMRESARRVLGLDQSARVVLHFGWDWEVKGGELLLAIADRLSHVPDLVFVTVLGEEIHARDRIDGRPNVRALAPSSEVTQLYAASDVFLSCSRYEGMPLAILEGLACGLPMVATDLPIHRRLLTGLPGAELITRDPSLGATAVERVAALSPEPRLAHERLARERAESYGLDGWAENLVDLYEAVIRS